MKKAVFLTIVLCSGFFHVFAQTYNLAVNNGYGDGTYQAGDTIAIYCQELLNNETFADWTFSIPVQNVTDTGEWWVRFVMPNTDVTVTASFLMLLYRPISLRMKRSGAGIP